MSAKRFIIPELETDNQKNRRLAAELTKAAECVFKVDFLPTKNFIVEDVLPVAMRESRGHVFRLAFIPSDDGASEFCCRVLLDDREQPLAEQVADHISEMAEGLLRLAANINAGGWKADGA